MKPAPDSFSERLRRATEQNRTFWRDLEAAQRLVDSKRPKPGVLTA